MQKQDLAHGLISRVDSTGGERIHCRPQREHRIAKTTGRVEDVPSEKTCTRVITSSTPNPTRNMSRTTTPIRNLNRSALPWAVATLNGGGAPGCALWRGRAAVLDACVFWPWPAFSMGRTTRITNRGDMPPWQ